MFTFLSLIIPSLRNTFKMTPSIVFVLGGPGAGKGTQCHKIVEHFGYVHLSAGDLLREERKNPNSKYGELIESYIKDGKIVPVEITCSLLEGAINSSNNHKFLIDGFPRNQDNLDGWNKIMEYKVNLQFVLVFDCSSEVCIERCLKRGSSSGRVDDNMASLQKRISTYLLETKPIIEHYEKMNLVRRIDGTNPEDVVFEQVADIFSDILEKK